MGVTISPSLSPPQNQIDQADNLQQTEIDNSQQTGDSSSEVEYSTQAETIVEDFMLEEVASPNDLHEEEPLHRSLRTRPARADWKQPPYSPSDFRVTKPQY